MVLELKSLQEILDYIETDRDENRFVARVFFLNNLEAYYSFVNVLSEKADETIRLSDERFCKGSDTVPDLKALISYLDENKNKDILIPNLAEYLRIGEKTEKNSACVYSILNRHVHSKKRVWIPIFLAKSLFQSIVGPLDEERFGHALFEIDDRHVDFVATAYSKDFADQKRIINAVGTREWLSLWDDQKIKSGMSFATRQIKQISPTNGDYTLKTVEDPFEYIRESLDANSKLSKQLGTNEQWASLVQFIEPNIKIYEVILHALNSYSFSPIRLLGSWDSLNENEKWAFFLWYRLGLNKSNDYVSFAVDQSNKYHNLLECIECSICDCLNNPDFDEWVAQRNMILENAISYATSQTFLEKLDLIGDVRIKLKLLTGRSHEERTKILEIVSKELKDGKSIDDFTTILYKNYPDLLLYLKPSTYLSGEVREYFVSYKSNKIADYFSLQLSNFSGQINCFQFKTRGSILHSLKNSVSMPYFLWFDGLGIEWIDMLLEKINGLNKDIPSPIVNIGTAILPTITKINMDGVDPDTVSEKKIDDLDKLSHIKDKSNCNYFSIVANQFELIGEFAQKIVKTIETHPDMEVIVTADHGMSRMAAMACHSPLIQGVDQPSEKVFNHGRYCELPSENSSCNISNTVKEGKYVMFRTHDHFKSQGYASGEVHGGASPEEWLVPILHFTKKNKQNSRTKTVNYIIEQTEIFLGNDGAVTLTIKTDKQANSLAVNFNGEIINGLSNDQITWTIKIPGLSAGKDYTIYVYPNNISSKKGETISVKTKGITRNDDYF